MTENFPDFSAELPVDLTDAGPAGDPMEAFGGFDMGALLEQAQQMQEQLVAAQAQLAQAEVRGTVANGAVSVTLSGVGDLLGVQIRTGEFDGNNAEDLTDLSDLLVAAYRDAKNRADDMATATLGPLAGGMPGMG